MGKINCGTVELNWVLNLMEVAGRIVFDGCSGSFLFLYCERTIVGFYLLILGIINGC